MEGKARVLNAAFPNPCCDTCSFTFPFPVPDVFSSLLYLQTHEVAFPSSFACSDTNRTNHNHNPPHSQLQPEQPQLPEGAQGKVAKEAQPTLLLAGKGRQSFGELEHPYCMWSFQVNSLTEGAQQLF